MNKADYFLITLLVFTTGITGDWYIGTAACPFVLWLINRRIKPLVEHGASDMSRRIVMQRDFKENCPPGIPSGLFSGVSLAGSDIASNIIKKKKPKIKLLEYFTHKETQHVPTSDNTD